MQTHLQFLRHQMRLHQHAPTLFEYYAAIHMSRLHHTCFYVYQDVPVSHKIARGFPATDKGIDLINETYDHIAQVKFYRSQRMIHYGKLSTFLATPLLVGRPQLQLTLLRTAHSTLHREIEAIVRRGGIHDIGLDADAFWRLLKTM